MSVELMKEETDLSNRPHSWGCDQLLLWMNIKQVDALIPVDRRNAIAKLCESFEVSHDSACNLN